MIYFKETEYKTIQVPVKIRKSDLTNPKKSNKKTLLTQEEQIKELETTILKQDYQISGDYIMNQLINWCL